MLSCKNCGAQMSGIDLVCKNCGTPWGKKHKSRPGIYFSALILLIVAGIAFYIIEGMITKTIIRNLNVFLDKKSEEISI